MIKKILGILFILLGALYAVVAYGSIEKGFSFDGSPAAAGEIIAMVVPTLLYVVSGILLLTFDGASKLDYETGSKKRGAQGHILLVLSVFFALLILLMGWGTGLNGGSTADYLIVILPFAVPFMILIYVYLIFISPFNTCKKHILKNNNDTLNNYMLKGGDLHELDAGGNILKNRTMLYFPKLFCIIPFECVESVKQVNELGIREVVFTLKNRKKITIYNCKQYDEIKAEFDAFKIINP